MRDLETIRLALEAANTGHLVFGTLHTTSAAKTIDRVIEVFPAEEQAQVRNGLSTGLKVVVAQNLFKRVDKKGRCAALEILVCTAAVGNLIREGKTVQIPSAIQTGKQYRHGRRSTTRSWACCRRAGSAPTKRTTSASTRASSGRCSRRRRTS